MARDKGLKTVGAGDSPPLDPTTRYLMPTTEQQDYERRRTEEAIARGEDIDPHPLSVDYAQPRSFAVEDNDTSLYVGVDPEYRTYARDTEAPMRAEGGAVELSEQRLLADENFPYQGPQAAPLGEQIVGTGSSTQQLLPATSGSAVNGVEVKVEKPADDSEGDQAPEVSNDTTPADGPAGDAVPSPGT